MLVVRLALRRGGLRRFLEPFWSVGRIFIADWACFFGRAGDFLILGCGVLSLVCFVVYIHIYLVTCSESSERVFCCCCCLFAIFIGFGSGFGECGYYDVLGWLGVCIYSSCCLYSGIWAVVYISI